MAWSARKAERVRLENKYPVNIMGIDGTWRRSCFLVDVSATGARLEVKGIPRSFEGPRIFPGSVIYRTCFPAM